MALIPTKAGRFFESSHHKVHERRDIIFFAENPGASGEQLREYDPDCVRR